MKIKIVLFLLSFLFVKLSAQTLQESSKTFFYVSAGYAYKYHYTEIHSSEKENNYFKNNNALLLNIGFGSEKNIYGIETIGFPYSYSDEANPKYFTWIFSPYYQRNIEITNNLSINLLTSFCLYSTDPDNILTTSLGVGISYDFNNIELFLKNSFRFSPGFAIGNYAPWFLSIGSTIKL